MQIPYFSRWHPLLALRYLPVIEMITDDDSVLEVGSGSLGIGPYLRREFTGVDLGFDGPDWSGMTKIKATAMELPFKNERFDVVVSLDMLEHLAPDKRKQAISEMIRVAKEKVIIGVPVGKLAHEQDMRLDEHYLKIQGKRHPFLMEQTEYGLPSVDQLSDFITESCGRFKKNYKLKIIPNINLKLREWMMRGWISKNFISNIFHRKLLLLVIPILRQMNQPPTYRQFFVVEFY